MILNIQCILPVNKRCPACTGIKNCNTVLIKSYNSIQYHFNFREPEVITEQKTFSLWQVDPFKNTPREILQHAFPTHRLYLIQTVFNRITTAPLPVCACPLLLCLMTETYTPGVKRRSDKLSKSKGSP